MSASSLNDLLGKRVRVTFFHNIEEGTLNLTNYEKGFEYFLKLDNGDVCLFSPGDIQSVEPVVI